MPAMDAEMHDEPTPRPAPREPALLKFERSLLLARQTETVETEEVGDEEEEEAEQEEMKEGSIISLPPSIAQGVSPAVRAVPLPISPLALAFTLGPVDPVMNDRGTPTPTPMSDPSSGVYFLSGTAFHLIEHCFQRMDLRFLPSSRSRPYPPLRQVSRSKLRISLIY